MDVSLPRRNLLDESDKGGAAEISVRERSEAAMAFRLQRRPGKPLNPA
jgi:hypothetical protein